MADLFDPVSRASVGELTLGKCWTNLTVTADHRWGEPDDQVHSTFAMKEAEKKNSKNDMTKTSRQQKEREMVPARIIFFGFPFAADRDHFDPPRDLRT